MSDLIHVTYAEARGGHRIYLRFDDGAEGELDLSDESWGGVLSSLADATYFADVALDSELGTIVWPNGADIAPETLHRWVTTGRNRLSV